MGLFVDKNNIYFRDEKKYACIFEIESITLLWKMRYLHVL